MKPNAANLITRDQALQLLPPGPIVHTFQCAAAGHLFGGDGTLRPTLLHYIETATALHQVDDGMFGSLEHRLVIDCPAGRFAVATVEALPRNPFADLDALEIKPGSEARANCEQLPEKCFALIACNEPGDRIVILKRGERGYFKTTLDSDRINLQHARDIVATYNKKLGVARSEKEAMIAGSLFGFEVPGANPQRYAALDNEDAPPATELKRMVSAP